MLWPIPSLVMMSSVHWADDDELGASPVYLCSLWLTIAVSYVWQRWYNYFILNYVEQFLISEIIFFFYWNYVCLQAVAKPSLLLVFKVGHNLALFSKQSHMLQPMYSSKMHKIQVDDSVVLLRKSFVQFSLKDVLNFCCFFVHVCNTVPKHWEVFSVAKSSMCCSWLHRLELLRQAQEKDGNSGH